MILDQFNLAGKVAIVTGASTGLGQGMAYALAEAGASIVGVDYVEMPETQKEIESKGGKFLGIVANLLTIEPIDGIIEKTIETFGKVDILVNNAGIIRRTDAIDFSVKDWDDVMNINIKTVFFFSQAVARQFIKQGTGGKIISVASTCCPSGAVSVFLHTPQVRVLLWVYRAMANEWAKYNINVNAIAPGYMATNNTAPLRADEERSRQSLKEYLLDVGNTC